MSVSFSHSLTILLLLLSQLLLSLPAFNPPLPTGVCYLFLPHHSLLHFSSPASGLFLYQFLFSSFSSSPGYFFFFFTLSFNLSLTLLCCFFYPLFCFLHFYTCYLKSIYFESMNIDDIQSCKENNGKKPKFFLFIIEALKHLA